MKRRKKRPDTNTNKVESGTFFPGVQNKLAVGKPGDAYEVEADKMADTVVNSSENANVQKKDATEEDVQQKPLIDAITPIQKQELAAEEEAVQKQEIPQEEDSIQAKEEDRE